MCLLYTLHLGITWRFQLFSYKFRSRIHKVRVEGKEMGKGEVDPLLCVLCALQLAAPNSSVPILFSFTLTQKWRDSTGITVCSF